MAGETQAFAKRPDDDAQRNIVTKCVVDRSVPTLRLDMGVFDMLWRLAGSLMLAGMAAACAAPEPPTVASIDAHCSDIAATGDEYRECVETGRERAGLALVQAGDTAMALRYGDE